MKLLTEAVDISFKELSYSINLGHQKGRKEILHRIKGTFPKKQLIGIMGPSGAGKTTLLNILSGLVSDYTGSVFINGEENLHRLRETSSYIMQDSNLQVLLTVEENLKSAADLKLGNNVEGRTKLEIIEETMNVLGLTNVRNTRISKISGGERKRLSIAQEIISNPGVIFVDEPTTGLDSSACQQCMEYLKYLSSRQTSIICTIHQPSATVFNMFDSIYVLSGGKCIYQGPPADLLPLLDQEGYPCSIFHNLADYVVEIANGDYGDDILNQLRSKYESDLNNGISKVTREITNYKLKCSSITKSDCYRLKVLMKREFIKVTRNPVLTYLRLITSVTNSLALSSLFWKVGSDGSKVYFNYNAILGTVLHFMMPALMLTALTFPMEMKSLKSECFNRWYSVKTYFLSLIVLDLPVSIIYCIVSNLIVYSLTDQPMESFRFLMFFSISFLITLVARSFGLLLGAMFDISSATFVGSAMSLPMVVFAGFGISFKDMPVYLSWLRFGSYLFYGVEGMIGAVLGYEREKLPCYEDFCIYRYPAKFLDDMGINGERFWTDVIVLTSMAVVLQFVAYVVMCRKVKKAN